MPIFTVCSCRPAALGSAPPPRGSEIAAVDVDGRPGHIRGQVTREERDDRRNFFGSADAPERWPHGPVEVTDAGRRDDVGCDSVDADPANTELEREGAGEVLHP